MATNSADSDQVLSVFRPTSARKRSANWSQSLRVLSRNGRACLSEMQGEGKMILRMGCYTLLIIIIGVLIVCLSPRRRLDETCSAMFEVTRQKLSDSSSSKPEFVTFADLNNDSHLDAVVAAPGSGQVLVFLNFGNGSFSMSVSYSTGRGSSPNSLGIADVNNDGILDIAVANYATLNIGILIGRGRGTFHNQITHSTGVCRPASLVVADVNSDGRVDLVFVSCDTDSVGVLLGRGNGSFGDVTSHSTGFDSSPRSVVAADLNNDSRLDLVVVNQRTDQVGIFLGHGNGSFAAQSTLPLALGSAPRSLAIADLNNDEHVDIVVVNEEANTVGLLFGRGGATFDNVKTLPTGPASKPTFVVIADLNNDHALDIVVINYGQDTLGVFLGSNNGAFAKQLIYPAQPGPRSIAFGDLNKDRRLDLLIVSNLSNYLDVFLGYYQVNFSSESIYSTGITSGSTSLTVGDFNGDTQADVAFLTSNTGDVHIFLARSNGTFARATTISTGVASNHSEIALAHLNNDEELDLIVTNSMSNTVKIFFGLSNETFITGVTYAMSNGFSPSSIVLADLNNDDRLDLIVGNAVSDTIAVLLGNSNGTFSPPLMFSTGVASPSRTIVVADWNDDLFKDLFVGNADAKNVLICVGFGNGTFALATTFVTEGSPMSLAVADLNNDALLDMVVACSQLELVQLFVGQHDKTFVTRVLLTLPSETRTAPQSLLIGDFNADTIPDIACSTFLGVLFVFTGNHNGSFLVNQWTVQDARSGSISASLATSDLNGDGLLDLLVGDLDLRVFLSSDSGLVSHSTGHTTGSSIVPFFIVAHDLNNDTRIDLAIVNEGTDDLTILLRQSNATDEKRYPTGFASHPHSLVFADFNQDELVDIVVSNSGSNDLVLFFAQPDGTFIDEGSFSTGVNSHPDSIAVGDFNGDTFVDVAVATADSAGLAILLLYDATTFIDSDLLTKVAGSRPNSLAVGHFNADEQMDAVLARSTTDDLVVLLGHANGSFIPVGTLSTGPRSAPRHVTTVDLNADQHLDLIVINNGTNDLGVFLGFGNGTFARGNVISIGEGFAPHSFVVERFNGDVHCDLVVITRTIGGFVVLLGRGDGTFSTSAHISTSTSPRSIAAGDFNNDQQMDLVIGNDEQQSLFLYFGRGDETFIERPSVFNVGETFAEIAVGDVDGDSWLDVVVGGSSSRAHFSVFLGSNQGQLVFAYRSDLNISASISSLIVTDLNNDGRLDLVCSHESIAPIDEMISVFIGRTNGRFDTPTFYRTASPSQSFVIALADLNNDQRLDIVIVDCTHNEVLTLQNYRKMALTSPSAYSIGDDSRRRSLAVGHFDSDDQLDIAMVSTDANALCVFRGLSNGSFVVGTNFSIGVRSSPWSIVAADMNNDERMDLIVSNYGADNIDIFVGRADGAFVRFATLSTGSASAPMSIVVVDLNSDRHLDIIVTHSGTNSIGVFLGRADGNVTDQMRFSLGFQTRPTSVAVGDFNSDGLLDIVATNSATDTLAFLLRSC